MGRPLPPADGGGGGGGGGASSGLGPLALLANAPAIAAFLACAAAQAAKAFLHWRQTGELSLERLFGSGGMPSSHSAAVAALATAVALSDGAGSSAFAVALVLAAVVCYDACGVRLHAGRHAHVINLLCVELAPDHAASEAVSSLNPPLNPRLGHTPEEVGAGAALGVGVGIVIGGIGLMLGRGGGAG
jgi:acid phosphatase family membrane protein YuiD